MSLARRARGWDQSELARRAGVSPSYISRIESGAHKQPSAQKLRLIADALRVPVAELIDGPQADPPKRVDLEARILHALNRFGDEGQMMVADSLEAVEDLPEREQQKALELFRTLSRNWPGRVPESD